MRPIAHWTPRYIVNRLGVLAYQRRNPDHPWLTREANRLLEGLLLPTDRGLELGSGRSTIWLARRLAHLTSVEHDRAWHGRVSQMLAEAGVTNVDHHLMPEGETAPDGTTPAYVRVVHDLPDSSLGFVLVDGVLRDLCVLAALPKLHPGGVLVIDNSNRYFPHATHSPASLGEHGTAPTDEWAKVAQLLRSWRSVWTSNGVTDTALYVKPHSG